MMAAKTAAFVTPAYGTCYSRVLHLYITRVTAVCDYDGVHYNQGQTWDDGCRLKCRCEDAERGLYVCDDRYVRGSHVYRSICFAQDRHFLNPFLY